MPNKHDYLYNWMEDENYKLLIRSASKPISTKQGGKRKILWRPSEQV